jgi:hypothetical protein
VTYLGIPKAFVIPRIALLSSAGLIIVLAAQTSLTCTDKVALPMSGDAMAAMPGMDMSMPAMAASHAIMVCPIVLILLGVSALLTAIACAMMWLDPHRALSQRALVTSLASLPPVRTVATVGLTGASAVGAMLWFEHAGLPALSICIMLAGLLCACSVILTLGAIVAARVAMAFGRRLILAIAAAIAHARESEPVRTRHFAFALANCHAVPLLASGRGLRAPPISVR